ncbi:MAG: flagellar hook-length control protein FliK [Acidobacteriota bacterium]
MIGTKLFNVIPEQGQKGVAGTQNRPGDKQAFLKQFVAALFAETSEGSHKDPESDSAGAVLAGQDLAVRLMAGTSPLAAGQPQTATLDDKQRVPASGTSESAVPTSGNSGPASTPQFASDRPWRGVLTSESSSEARPQARDLARIGRASLAMSGVFGLREERPAGAQRQAGTVMVSQDRQTGLTTTDGEARPVPQKDRPGVTGSAVPAGTDRLPVSGPPGGPENTPEGPQVTTKSRPRPMSPVVPVVETVRPWGAALRGASATESEASPAGQAEEQAHSASVPGEVRPRPASRPVLDSVTRLESVALPLSSRVIDDGTLTRSRISGQKTLRTLYDLLGGIEAGPRKGSAPAPSLTENPACPTLPGQPLAAHAQPSAGESVPPVDSVVQAPLGRAEPRTESKEAGTVSLRTVPAREDGLQDRPRPGGGGEPTTEGAGELLPSWSRQAPVKSSENESRPSSVAIPIPSREAAESLFDQVVARARVQKSADGPIKLSVDLKPEVFGRLEIETAITADQLVTAVIRAEDPSVQKMVESHLPTLLERLQESGIRIDSAQVASLAADSGGEPKEHAERQPGFQRSSQPPSHNPSTGAEGEDQQLLERHDGAIDYFA